MNRVFALLTLLLAIGLGGCLPGTDTQRLQSQLAALNLVIRDSATAVAALKGSLPQAVWVTIYKVEGVDESGQVVTFFDAGPQGEVLNLVSTTEVATLLENRNVPARTYTKIRLVLGTEVRVMQQNGSNKTYSVPNTTPPDFTLEIPVDVQLAADTIRSLILQLDLGQLQAAIDDGTGQIDLNQLIVDSVSTDPTTVNGIQARLEGRLANVANQGFTLLRNEAPAVVVTLHPTLAVIVDERQGTILTPAQLNPGDIAEVFGSFDPTSLTMTALAVSVDPQPVARGDSETVRDQRVEAEGYLSNVDNAAGSAELTLLEASFLPSSASISVIDLANALYRHGSFSQLADGVRVEIKGTWDGTQLDADIVDLEGALPSEDTTTDGEEAPREIHGTVVSWDDQTQSLTLQVSDSEVPGYADGDQIELKLADAWFKEGTPRCLAPNVELTVKGLFGTPEPVVTMVEVDEDCSPYREEGHDTSHDGSSSDDDSMHPGEEQRDRHHGRDLDDSPSPEHPSGGLTGEGADEDGEEENTRHS